MKKEKQRENEHQTVQTAVQKDSHMTNLLVIFTALVFIALSAVVLFVPNVELDPSYLCYVVGAAVIIAGIVGIVRYFVTDAYRNVNAYGFSTGTLLVILGICALLRADVLAGVIDLVLGIAVLLMGIIMLQHSLDLKRMSDAVWGLVIVLAVIVTACGVVLILKPSPIQISYDAVIWWIVFVSSALGLLVNIYTMIRVAIYTHREKKKAAQEMKEREQAILAEAEAEATAANAEAATTNAASDVYAASDSSETSYTVQTPVTSDISDDSLPADAPAASDVYSDIPTDTSVEMVSDTADVPLKPE